ncbi:MAG: protease complex subunit PrcB family protein [Gemmatimonadaceae bacterium]
MTREMHKLLPIALVALSCGTGSSEAEQDSAAPPGTSQQLTVREIPQATVQTSSITQSTRLVIRDAASWNQFWGRMVAGVLPAPPAPTVDFSAHVVIAAAMGQRNTGGYTITIDSVRLERDTIRAVVKSVSPGAGCGTIQILTAPVAAVTVNRVGAPVVLIERSETKPCS